MVDVCCVALFWLTGVVLVADVVLVVVLVVVCEVTKDDLDLGAKSIRNSPDT